MTARRYFFNQVSPGLEGNDLAGRELDSIAEAKLAAVRHAADIMRDDPDIIWRGEEFQVAVTDAQGLELFTVTIYATDAPALKGQ